MDKRDCCGPELRPTQGLANRCADNEGYDQFLLGATPRSSPVRRTPGAATPGSGTVVAWSRLVNNLEPAVCLSALQSLGVATQQDLMWIEMQICRIELSQQRNALLSVRIASAA